MRHSHTSRGLRTTAKTILAFVALGFVGACADSVSAPTAEVSANAPAAYSKTVGVWTFEYTPRDGATKRIGDNMIVIPANGVCDPRTSGYGSAYWDAPCNAVNHSIVFTAIVLNDLEGHPYVDFSPAVRFVPTKETYLYLRDGKRKSADLLEIFYCSTAVTCVDESLTDPSLATHRIGKSQVLGRRLKHFSGYNIAANGACRGGSETLDDGSQGCNDNSQGNSRSGYMVASGLGKNNGSSDSFGRRRRADK
jgi:hypothetical protein